jgi:hypothetical protein
MVEHMDHAGQENGRLKVTWRDFEKFGVQRRRIKQALGELVAVGLVAIEDPGRSIIWGESKGDPAQYRLTHLPVSEPDNFRPATNEWKRFEDDVGAASAAIKVALARQPIKPNDKANGKWRAKPLWQRQASPLLPEKIFSPDTPLIPETGTPLDTWRQVPPLLPASGPPVVTTLYILPLPSENEHHATPRRPKKPKMRAQENFGRNRPAKSRLIGRPRKCASDS